MKRYKYKLMVILAGVTLSYATMAAKTDFAQTQSHWLSAKRIQAKWIQDIDSHFGSEINCTLNRKFNKTVTPVRRATLIATAALKRYIRRQKNRGYYYECWLPTKGIALICCGGPV